MANSNEVTLNSDCCWEYTRTGLNSGFGMKDFCPWTGIRCCFRVCDVCTCTHMCLPISICRHVLVLVLVLVVLALVLVVVVVQVVFVMVMVMVVVLVVVVVVVVQGVC